MTKDAKYRFLSRLERLAEELYHGGDSLSHDESWEKKRSFLVGFREAGMTIGLVNAEETQEVIDRAHVTVFGEERVARIERLKPIGDGESDPNWDAFDTPTYERKPR